MFNGQIGAGTLVMIVQLSNDFINPITMILDQINQIHSTKPIWDKIKMVLQSENKNSISPKQNFSQLKITNLSYSIGKKTVLKNINFTVEAGEKVLLMAPSGFGKTTLLRLLIGQLQPTSGSIVIDHQDLTGNWAKAHDYFGYINQKPYMFDRSLLFNLTLGKEYSKDDLTNAIKLAGLPQLVDEKGLDYQVGQNGNNLSGGQTQRIEIARAILAKRPILLADEATSALDNKLSLQIHQTLLNNPNFAIIEVAHKISDQEKKLFDRIVDLSSFK